MTKDEALKLALEALQADELDMVDDGSGNMVFRKEQAITAILAQTQEPVCPDCKAKVLYECVACSSNNYPPQCKTLTDKEIEAIWEVAMFAKYGVGAELSNQPFVHFARAIEAKLREKNT